MYCSNCGTQISKDVKFCNECGTPVYSNTNQTYNSYSSNPIALDVPSFWMRLVSFFIPLVGIILLVLWYKERPKCAAACGKAVAASVVIAIILVAMVFIFNFAFLSTQFFST